MLLLTKYVAMLKSCLCFADCEDNNHYCASWATRGECQRNPGYMLVYCRLSCDVC